MRANRAQPRRNDLQEKARGFFSPVRVLSTEYQVLREGAESYNLGHDCAPARNHHDGETWCHSPHRVARDISLADPVSDVSHCPFAAALGGRDDCRFDHAAGVVDWLAAVPYSGATRR